MEEGLKRILESSQLRKIRTSNRMNEAGQLFLPVDPNIEKFRRAGVPFTEIMDAVGSPVTKTILFIDTCLDGNIMGAIRSRGLQ
jgi:hypothetical protein